METPCDKRYNNEGFSSRANLFNSSGLGSDIFFRENNHHSPYDFSMNKYFLTTYKKPISRYTSTRQKKNEFSSLNISMDKENCKEIHKLNVKKSLFKINNINFHIKLSYMK